MRSFWILQLYALETDLQRFEARSLRASQDSHGTHTHRDLNAELFQYASRTSLSGRKPTTLSFIIKYVLVSTQLKKGCHLAQLGAYSEHPKTGPSGF